MEKRLTIDDFDLIENDSKIYYNGSVWNSKRYDKFTIIGRVNEKRHNEYPYFLCEFEDGTIVKTQYYSIKRKEVRNPYFPNVCGIGFVGQGDAVTAYNSKTSKEYILWNHMINRCYNEKELKKRPSYEDVTVCERWLNFQLFYSDLLKIKNFDKWYNNTTPLNNWQIDKDLLCNELNISPKIYSPETCMFITSKENNSEKNKRVMLTGLVYIATRLSDGYIEEFTNQREFCRKYDLERVSVGKRIKGILNTPYKGWMFRIKE